MTDEALACFLRGVSKECALQGPGVARVLRGRGVNPGRLREAGICTLDQTWFQGEEAARHIRRLLLSRDWSYGRFE